MGKYRQGHGQLLLKMRDDRIIILTSRRAGGGSNCTQTRIFGGKICNQPLTLRCPTLKERRQDLLFDILLKPESSFSYMPTNTKRKGQLNTEIAKGHRGKEREHTDDELSKTEKGKSSLHLLKIKNIATRCRTSVCML